MERAETSMTLVSASSELDTLCASLTVSFSKLLLFSRSVMCDTFATPWTVACQAPHPWDSPGCGDSVLLSCSPLIPLREFRE